MVFISINIIQGGDMESCYINKVKEIDSIFTKFYEKNKYVLSIFVVGSMYDIDAYSPRKNNDYDVRILVDSVTEELLKNVMILQKEISEAFSDGEVCVGYNNLVGPVNHNLSDKPFNLLLHIIVHTVDDLHVFLPLTHQRKYKHYHRIICGDDYLLGLCDTYKIEYLIDCHEGINYCIDMLLRKKYKYLEWVVNGTNVEFVYKEKDYDDSLKYEMVFYSIKNIVLNLYEILIVEKGVEQSISAFVEKLICYEADRLLIDAVMKRDEIYLDKCGEALNKITIECLVHIRDKIINKELE